MRLLNTTDLTFEEFFDSEVPKYAILSHRWVSGQEISYEDVIHNRFHDKSGTLKSGWEKIQWFARLAKAEDECEWCWVDTCCIDKKSSAELSEAINSMFAWYRKSAVCIAYLFDVDENIPEKTLEHSQWFRRGWTLQELLAPRECRFYAGDRILIGDRDSLEDRISAITGIHSKYLGQRDASANVAQKLSWASQRETTRVEDKAYCLLGLLRVNMPLLYGEGHQAFRRLQTEFIRQYDDESIFAWLPVEKDLEKDLNSPGLSFVSMLAPSPAAFSRSGTIVRERSPLINRPPYYMTHKGLQIQVPSPFDTMADSPRFALLQLECKYLGMGEKEKYVYLLMYTCRADLWARIGLPFHIVSGRSRYRFSRSSRSNVDDASIQTMLVGYDLKHRVRLAHATASITRSSLGTSSVVEIESDQAPTLAALNLPPVQ